MMLPDSLKLVLLACLNIAAMRDGSWWEIIPESLRLIFSLTLFLVNLFVLAVVLYFAGLIVIGKRQSPLSNAFIISLLGTVLSTVLFMFVPYRYVGLLLSIVIWLLLIKNLYKTGWFKACAIGLLAMILFLAITIILALIFGIVEAVWELLVPSLLNCV